MTSPWRALHVYSSALEPLLLERIGPFFERHATELEEGFWERHYAGGTHVRVRLRAEPARLEALVGELRAELEAHLAAQPSPDVQGYSVARVAKLLELEGLDPANEDLEYRNNVVLERPYPVPGQTFASPGARALAESFRRRSGPLALRLLASDRSRREEVLRLYLGLALFVGRRQYPPGCVSYKSHWEGFAATFPVEQVVERIREGYVEHRERLLELVEEVQAGQAAGFESDPLLAEWWRLLDETRTEARALFERGEALIEHPESLEAAAQMREKLFTIVRRPSDFVETLWADERFITLLRHDLAFHVPRVLVNLLYDLVAAVGLAPLDKMALCHHVFRAVEEARQCDLNALLRENMAAVVAKQLHRLEPSEPAPTG
jgi:hypothetical protein